MFIYDAETIKHLVKLARDRDALEAETFLLEFLETLIPGNEFEKFLAEIGQ